MMTFVTDYALQLQSDIEYAVNRFCKKMGSFEDMIKLNDTGYFPYTPATQLMRGLRNMCSMLPEP